MHDFLRPGAFIASSTEGDDQAKLRAFGDDVYDSCLSNESALTDFLRKRNSDEDIHWLTTIVAELCPVLQPDPPAGAGAKLGGRHYIHALMEIRARYEKLRRDDAQSAAAEVAPAAAAAAAQQPPPLGTSARRGAAYAATSGYQEAAWSTYTVAALKDALRSNGLGQSGRKVCLRRAPLPAPPARGPLACATRARDHRTHLRIEPP